MRNSMKEKNFIYTYKDKCNAKAETEIVRY